MYNELTIAMRRKKYRVFLQNGFYSPFIVKKNLHKHNFAEVHLVANGSAVFSVGDRIFPLHSGSLLLIPRGIFHCPIEGEKDTLHTAFQIDCEVNAVSVYDIEPDSITRFLREIEACKTSQDYSRIAIYIALFCSFFLPDEKVPIQPVTDYGFLIHEFLSVRYGEDLRLTDLADYLHLSERQCERLVIEHTGNTFREELATVRMNIAGNLLKTSNMSLKEIAEYVGYRSYAGFWKAMKKHHMLSSFAVAGTRKEAAPFRKNTE